MTNLRVRDSGLNPAAWRGWSRDQTPSASDLTKPERLREAAKGQQSELKNEHHDEAEQINTANFPTFDEAPTDKQRKRGKAVGYVASLPSEPSAVLCLYGYFRREWIENGRKPAPDRLTMLERSHSEWEIKAR